MVLMATPVCKFGEKAVDFSAKDASGKEYRLLDTMGDNGLLVMFICNHCPYVIAVIERLAEDCKAIQKNGIGVVAVMSNDYGSYPDDAPEK